MMDNWSSAAWLNCYWHTASSNSIIITTANNTSSSSNTTNNYAFLAVTAVVTAVVTVMAVVTVVTAVAAMATVMAAVVTVVMAAMTAAFFVSWGCFFRITTHCISRIFSIFVGVVTARKFFGVFICCFFFSLAEHISTITCIDNVTF